MKLLVNGQKAAKQVAALCEKMGAAAAHYRCSGSCRTYWVDCPALTALGEQELLERMGAGSLVRVEAATYKNSAKQDRKAA